MGEVLQELDERAALRAESAHCAFVSRVTRCEKKPWPIRSLFVKEFSKVFRSANESDVHHRGEPPPRTATDILSMVWPNQFGTLGESIPRS